jgi:hypothetical protein
MAPSLQGEVRISPVPTTQPALLQGSVSRAVDSRDGPLEACRSARDRCRRSGRGLRRLHSRLARRIGGAFPCDRPPRWRRDSQTGGSDSLRSVTRGRSTESVLYTPQRRSAPGHLLPGRCPRLAAVPWAGRAAVHLPLATMVRQLRATCAERQAGEPRLAMSPKVRRSSKRRWRQPTSAGECAREIMPAAEAALETCQADCDDLSCAHAWNLVGKLRGSLVAQFGAA